MEQDTHNMMRESGSRGMTAGFVAALVIVLAAAASLCGIAYLNHLSSEMVQKNLVDVRNEALHEADGAQQRALERREWIDQDKGTARIPIEDAIKVLAEAEKDGQPS